MGWGTNRLRDLVDSDVVLRYDSLPGRVEVLSALSVDKRRGSSGWCGSCGSHHNQWDRLTGNHNTVM